jgi:hypothetical protein
LDDGNDDGACFGGAGYGDEASGGVGVAVSKSPNSSSSAGAATSYAA